MWHQLRAVKSRVVRTIIQRGALPALSLVALSGCAKGKGDSVEEISFSQFVFDLVKTNVGRGPAGPQKQNFVEKKKTALKKAIDTVVQPPLPVSPAKLKQPAASASGVTPFPNPWKKQDSPPQQQDGTLPLATLLEEGLLLVKTGHIEKLSNLAASVLGLTEKELLPLLKRFGPVWQTMDEKTVQQLVQMVRKFVRTAHKVATEENGDEGKIVAALLDSLQDVLEKQELTGASELAWRALPMLREIVESEGACTTLKKLILSFKPEDLPVSKQMISRLVELEPVLASLSKQQWSHVLAVALRDVNGNEAFKPQKLKQGMRLFVEVARSSEYQEVVAMLKNLVREWRDKVPGQARRDQAVDRLLRIAETVRPAKSSSSSRGSKQLSVDQQVRVARTVLAEIPAHEDTIALALPVLSRLSDDDFELLAKVIVGAVRLGGGSGLGALTPSSINTLVEHAVALLDHTEILRALPDMLTALQGCAGKNPVRQYAALRGSMKSVDGILLSEDNKAAKVRRHVMAIVSAADPKAIGLLRKLIGDQSARGHLRVALRSGDQVFVEEWNNLEKLAEGNSLGSVGSVATQCPTEIETLRRMVVGLGQQNREQRVTRLLQVAKVARGLGLLDRQNVQLEAEAVCSHVKLAAHLADEIDSGVRWLLGQNDESFALVLGFLKWASENHEHFMPQRPNQHGQSSENPQAGSHMSQNQIKQLVTAIVGLAQNMDNWQSLLRLVPRFVNAANGNSNREELAQVMFGSLPLVEENLFAEGSAGTSRREYLRSLVEIVGPNQAEQLFDAVLGTSEGREHIRVILGFLREVSVWRMQGNENPILQRSRTKFMITEAFSKLESFKWAMTTFDRFSRGDSLRWFRENDDEKVRSGFDLAVRLVPHVVGLANRFEEHDSLLRLQDLVLGFVDWPVKDWEQRWALIYDNLDLIQKELLKRSSLPVREHVHAILKLAAEPYAPLFEHMVIQQSNRKNVMKGLAMLQKVWVGLNGHERSKLIHTAKKLCEHYHQQLQDGIGSGADENTDRLLAGLTDGQGQKLIEGTLRLLAASQGKKSFTQAVKSLLAKDDLARQLIGLIKSAQKLQETVAAAMGQNSNNMSGSSLLNRLPEKSLSFEFPIRLVLWLNKETEGVLQNLNRVRALLDKFQDMLSNHSEFSALFSQRDVNAEDIFDLLTGEQGEALVSELYCVGRSVLADFKTIEEAFSAGEIVGILRDAKGLTFSSKQGNANSFEKVEHLLELALRYKRGASFLMSTASRLLYLGKGIKKAGNGFISIFSKGSKKEKKFKTPVSKLEISIKLIGREDRREAVKKLLAMYGTWVKIATPPGLAEEDKKWVALASTSIKLAKIGVHEQRLLEARLQQEQQQAGAERVSRPVVGNVAAAVLDQIDVGNQRDLLLAGWGIAENLDLEPGAVMAASASPGRVDRVFSAAGAIQATSLRKLPALGDNAQWWLDLVFEGENMSTILAVLRELNDDLNDNTSLVETAVRLQEKVMTELDWSVFEEMLNDSDGGGKLKKLSWVALERLFSSKDSKSVSPMATFVNLYFRLGRIEKAAMASEQGSAFGESKPSRNRDQPVVGSAVEDFTRTMKKLQGFLQDEKQGLPWIYDVVRHLFLPQQSLSRSKRKPDPEPDLDFPPPLGFERERPLVAAPAG